MHRTFRRGGQEEKRAMEATRASRRTRRRTHSRLWRINNSLFVTSGPCQFFRPNERFFCAFRRGIWKTLADSTSNDTKLVCVIRTSSLENGVHKYHVGMRRRESFLLKTDSRGSNNLKENWIINVDSPHIFQSPLCCLCDEGAVILGNHTLQRYR
jgi:hypothetical protein